jgi:hypothetical protein
MTTVWASRHEDPVSHESVSPHMCDPMVVPHGEAVLERGNPLASAGTPTVTLPHRRDGLNVLLMVVLCPFRRPSLCRPVHCALMHSGLLDLTTIVPATPCHQRNYVEPYSRCRRAHGTGS